MATLAVNIPYNLELVARLKSIPGARWDPKRKRWLISAQYREEAQRLVDDYYRRPPVVARPHQWHFSAPPRDWQRDCLEYAYDKPAVLLHVPMRLGKSRAAVDIVVNRGHERTLVVCPKSVVPVWSQQFARWAAPDTFATYELDTGSVAKNLAIAKEALASDAKPVVCIINYDSVWREPFASWAVKQQWGCLILDECFVAGASISTPRGAVPIEALRVGDVILGYDHESRRVVETQVVQTFERRALRVQPFYNTYGTRNHPVWTNEDGYVPMGDLDSMYHTVLKLQHGGVIHARFDMPGVREAVQDALPTKEVLWDELLSQVAHATGSAPYTVFNIETGTGNYFVEDFLVHNCHRCKGAGTRVSRFTHRLGFSAQQRLGLSGTPLAHSPLDAYGVYRALAPHVFGTSYKKFQERYAVMGGFGNYELLDWKNQDEFRQKIDSIRFHVSENVLALTPTQHIDIPISLPPTARRVYRDLAKDFYAAVDRGEVTASNVLVKLLRLMQVTSGYITTDTGEHVPLHAAKEQALADLLEGLDPAEPVVVFSRFTADLEAVCRAATGQGRYYYEMSGAAKELEAWRRDTRGSVLGVQIGTGSEGVDMSRARYCVFYSVSYSLAQYDQAIARLRSTDTTQTAAYYHLIVPHSVDQAAYTALQNRREVIDEILEGRTYA